MRQTGGPGASEEVALAKPVLLRVVDTLHLWRVRRIALVSTLVLLVIKQWLRQRRMNPMMISEPSRRSSPCVAAWLGVHMLRTSDLARRRAEAPRQIQVATHREDFTKSSVKKPD